MWVSIQELQDLMHNDKLNILLLHFGPCTIYIPRYYDPSHILSKIIGEEAAKALIKVYGGENITLPSGKNSNPHKANIINMLEQGHKVSQIAQKLKVTERYVYTIASLLPKARQLTFFEL